jgi:hypothetical protein
MSNGPLRDIGSSDLAGVAHDPVNDTLDVRFRKGGRTRRYFGVGELVYQGLLNSESNGTFFNRNVRNHYRSEWLD